MKSSVLIALFASLFASCNNCEECGEYIQDGNKSHDRIRLNDDGSYDFKDRRDSCYIFAGNWKLENTSLTLISDTSFENGRMFIFSLKNDTIFDELNTFIKTSAE